MTDGLQENSLNPKKRKKLNRKQRRKVRCKINKLVRDNLLNKDSDYRYDELEKIN